MTHSEIDSIVRRAGQFDHLNIWIHRCSDRHVQAQFAAAQSRDKSGVEQPLLGKTFAIKDNIDFTGLPTTAGCPAFSYVAKQTATVVQRLCDAGAILVGKTNMDQFATGLVGIRSPYGACRNPFNPDYIAGGSSSGSAVAVALGLVDFALGTDTAGSGRVPAAFNNIVGFKPTRGLLSTAGVVPACRSLDCVSIFANSSLDALQVFNIAQRYDPADPFSRQVVDLPRGLPIYPGRFRFGVPKSSQLQFFGNAEVPRLYEQTIDRLESIGGERLEIDYAPFADVAAMLYGGPWVAERYLVVRELLERDPNALLPVTRQIISRGATVSAADTFSAIYELKRLEKLARVQFDEVDLLLLPTAGTIYRIDEVHADPVALNTNLGSYTNFANLLDMCAVSVPAGFQSNGLPAGVSLFARAGCDGDLLTIACRLHDSLDIPAGVLEKMKVTEK